MKRKCYILGLCSIIISIVIFIFTYFVFHYLGADCVFVSEFHLTPEKPFVTQLLGIFGVFFLFAGIICLLVGKIFFNKR